MSKMLDISLTGGKELEAKLKELETKVSQKIVRQAVRKAQKHLLNATKTYLAVISRGGGMAQKIAKALQIKVPKQETGGYQLDIWIRPNPEFVYYRRGSHSVYKTGRHGERFAGKTVGRSYIPAAIEYGHGKNKKQSARPFMRPAADTTVAARINILNKELRVGIAKIWKSRKAAG